MLMVDQRIAFVCLADLHDVAVALVADRQRIQAQHQIHGKRAASERPLPHPHPPVWRLELGFTARAALPVEETEHDRVVHERPARPRRLMMHPRMRILREGRSRPPHQQHDD
jgi:hypothetical protein